MSASKNMTVSVGGIDITIQTDEDRGYIQKLAAKVPLYFGCQCSFAAPFSPSPNTIENIVSFAVLFLT